MAEIKADDIEPGQILCVLEVREKPKAPSWKEEGYEGFFMAGPPRPPQEDKFPPGVPFRVVAVNLPFLYVSLIPTMGDKPNSMPHVLDLRTVTLTKVHTGVVAQIHKYTADMKKGGGRGPFDGIRPQREPEWRN